MVPNRASRGNYDRRGKAKDVPDSRMTLQLGQNQIKRKLRPRATGGDAEEFGKNLRAHRAGTDPCDSAKDESSLELLLGLRFVIKVDENISVH